MSAHQVALGADHAPRDLCDPIAPGFTRAPRFCAGTRFARRRGPPAPAIATLHDMAPVVRADEACDVNRGFASELAGAEAGAVSPCPGHATELRPEA